MPHVIWDEDLDEIQNLVYEVRAHVSPLPVTLIKKLVRIEKLLKSIRGELEPDEKFAVLEPEEKLRQSQKQGPVSPSEPRPKLIESLL